MSNKPEDDINRVKLSKPLFPYRYYVMSLILTTTVVVFAVRCTINVAIIAMVGPSKDKHVASSNLTQHSDSQSHFNWNQNDQGIILGAYFYTYSAVQPIAGLLTDKFNVVHLMAGSQLIATICTFATPYAAKQSMNHLIIVRMIMGLIHGVTLPSIYNLIEKWFLPSETGLAQGFMAFGCDFGTAAVSLFTAWISQRNLWGGWPAAFYIMGLINAIFGIIWVTTLTVDPKSNRFVSEYEKQQLSVLVGNKKCPKKKKSTPWLKLFTSLPLWSVIIAKGFIGVAYAVINTKIPLYLDSVLDFKLENNGLINSFFYLAVAISQLLCGPLSKYIITKKWLPVTTTRKLFESIALAGVVASLVTICYSGDHPYLIVFCLVLAMFFYGFNLGGDVPIIPEMAPGLVGTAFGLSNTLSCVAGFIAPALIGAILGEDAGDKNKWFLAFQITAFLQVIALIFFNIFATSDPQSWAKLEDDDTFGDDNDLPDKNQFTPKTLEVIS